MSRMTKQNLHNIKARFTRQTGVELEVSPAYPVKKLLVLAAILVSCFAFAAFCYPLFTPLDGDALALRGTYEGKGIVSVYVENGSAKDLKFQKQTKLMCWDTSQEVPRLGGRVTFENTHFPAHSGGTMTIDLSKAYDIAALEQGQEGYSYYLLLTNNAFLFGHDWICSVDFQPRQAEAPAEAPAEASIPTEVSGLIPEELRPYFQKSYQDSVFAWEEAHTEYLQQVDTLLAAFPGKVVVPVYPTIFVSGPSTMLDPQPQIQTEAMARTGAEWVTLDGYHRLVGGGMFEKALSVTAEIPLSKDSESFTTFPIRYLFVYETPSLSPDAYSFVSGQLYSFEALEEKKVFADAHYQIYDMTDFIRGDLNAYLDFLQATNPSLEINGKLRQQIHEANGYYKENISNLIRYLDTESSSAEE